MQLLQLARPAATLTSYGRRKEGLSCYPSLQNGGRPWMVDGSIMVHFWWKPNLVYQIGGKSPSCKPIAKVLTKRAVRPAEHFAPAMARKIRKEIIKCSEGWLVYLLGGCIWRAMVITYQQSSDIYHWWSMLLRWSVNDTDIQGWDMQG